VVSGGRFNLRRAEPTDVKKVVIMGQSRDKRKIDESFMRINMVKSRFYEAGVSRK
jgi:hypothetical protein